MVNMYCSKLFYLILYLLTVLSLPVNSWVTFFAPLNAIGLKGNITFRQENAGDGVTISVNLVNTDTKSSNDTNFSWKIMSFPYHSDSKCDGSLLGKVEHDMSSRHGPIKVPSSIYSKMNENQIFVDHEVTLKGRKTAWSSSIIITKDGSNQAGCANIFNEGEVRSARAIFNQADFVGTIIFRENEFGDTIIISNLFHATNDFKINSQHDWKILVTDVFDTRRESKCNYLQDLLDPDNVNDKNCSESDHLSCKMGSMSRKHGKITIFKVNSRTSKQKFIDTNLPLSLLTGSRDLYVVLYKKEGKNQVLGCAKIDLITPKEVKALVDMDGVKGYIGFSQSFPTDPTIVTIKLENNRHRGYFLHVHQFPVPPRMTADDDLCSINAIGPVYNPTKVNTQGSRPLNGQGTADQYMIGDLSGKHGHLLDDDKGNVMQIHVDLKLPLFGRNSIIGRSLAINKADGSTWVCATIGYPGPMITAVARFHFPVVGSVIMRQEVDKPRTETTVLVDLSYSDGSGNDTVDHKWEIHEKFPGLDFYNWSSRCVSTGDVFNPHKIGSTRNYAKECSFQNPLRCVIGDLTAKSNHQLSIAGHRGSTLVKFFYTDPTLPLSGSTSIMGRSLVIFDEHGPKQRGNRLGCTTIRALHPLTASVRHWTGSKTKLSGSIVFNQASVNDPTNGKIDLLGLEKQASGFHIHEVRVPEDREFPCSQDSVYDHFNPLNLDSSVTPYPGVGSSDQYPVGDLSGKLGTLDDKDSRRCEYIDTNLPLHGQHSIIGRSIVIHKKEKGNRWICGTVEADERNRGAREIVAIASFDDPQHLVSGFVRFRQYEFKDGAVSDTWLEIDLKHQGAYNRNVTSGHKWAIFVNQVGADAFLTDKKTRCIAGGFRWNPYFVDSERNRDLYAKDCSPLNPLRCELGDLSGRNGPLTIGGKRTVMSDINLPLVGYGSIMSRSLVIFDTNKNGEGKLACTKISPDLHLISNIAIQNNPRLTLTRFMEEMRRSLDSREWLIKVDTHSSKLILDNECLQMTVHFYGSEAFRLQTEFNNLINFGTITKHDRLGARKISTFYQPCRPMVSSQNDSSSPSSPSSIMVICLLVIISLLRLSFD
ncbi:superoxide dismutase family protein Rsod [Brevipalpus obovatus]|uniref:superoxide dismutase family protein Rsod n=1 Tax=Brevipalpus obovatus TaxID=246614 RepID=UPI003D9E84D0